jgi:hypothetical protein
MRNEKSITALKSRNKFIFDSSQSNEQGFFLFSAYVCFTCLRNPTNTLAHTTKEREKIDDNKNMRAFCIVAGKRNV